MMINDCVPRLSPDVIFIRHSQNDILVENTKFNYQLKVNELTFNLINLVDNIRTIREITNLFNVEYSSSVDSSTVHDILFNKLSKYAIIIVDDNEIKPRTTSKYLFLKFTILNSRIVNAISDFTKFFIFAKNKFIYLLLIFFLIAVLIINLPVLYSNKHYFNSSYFIWFILIMRLSNLWHELGHASASKKYSIEPGNIGFGFYLFMPVFFTDVSKIWRINRNSRIVVNVGGIYFDTLLSLVLIFVYYLTDWTGCIVLSYFISISILYNLNPLVRYDGYWVLVDLFNIPNLQKDSSDLVYNCLFKRQYPHSIREILIFSYGILSKIYIITILIVLFFVNNEIFTYFPLFAYKIFSFNLNSIHFSYAYVYNLIISGLIYVLGFKFIYFRILIKYLR